MRSIFSAALIAAMFAANLPAQLQTLHPGFNLFTPEQDIQLGKEARTEIERKVAIVRNRELADYLDGIGQRLAKSPHAAGFPYSFSVVYDKNINAFSLPGGPVYVNTGVVAACDNEAQLAGVLAHEMSHIALRHGTSQLSKQNLIALPAALAGAVVGNNSILGQIARLGIGLGASSVLLRFSRTAEAQADYNGAEIMADAGYNPIEMARFFEKLEAKDPHEGSLTQFLSDHPNPGNRVQAVEDEVRHLPRRSYQDDSPRFHQIQTLAAHVAAPGQLHGEAGDGNAQPSAPAARPSRSLRAWSGRSFSFSYPDNWQVYGGADGQGNSLTVAPPEGLLQGADGQTAVGYGMMVSHYFPQDDNVDLRAATAALIRQLESENAAMHRDSDRDIDVDGNRAILTTLYSQSAFRGEGSEVDALLTVARPEGLFYMIFIAPQTEFGIAQPTFEDIVRSVRFR